MALRICRWLIPCVGIRYWQGLSGGIAIMLKISFAALCLSLLMLDRPACAEAPAEAVIGTVMEVEGQAWISSPVTKTKTAAKVETPLHINDVIDTGPKSRVFILFIDNTQITLSANTKFRAEDYVFDESAPAYNKARYNVMSGTFQYLSGALGKTKDPDVEIETPYGAIGIRGTKSKTPMASTCRKAACACATRVAKSSSTKARAHRSKAASKNPPPPFHGPRNNSS